MLFDLVCDLQGTALNSTPDRLFTSLTAGAVKCSLQTWKKSARMSSKIKVCFIYKQTLRVAFLGEFVNSGAPTLSRSTSSDKHMKATGLVRLQPHLDEEIFAVPVGDVQKEPSDCVTGEDQSETSL